MHHAHAIEVHGVRQLASIPFVGTPLEDPSMTGRIRATLFRILTPDWGKASPPLLVRDFDE